MSVNLRSAIGIATIWVATVAGVSATAWIAVDRAGRDIADAGVSSSLVTTSDTATAGSDPSPSVTIGSPTAASLTPMDRSFSVAGGQLSVRCTGDTILLRIAQPSNGWRVDVGRSDAQAVNLAFEKGGEAGEDSEVETRVKAFCENGTPAINVTAKTKPHSETGDS